MTGSDLCRLAVSAQLLISFLETQPLQEPGKPFQKAAVSVCTMGKYGKLKQRGKSRDHSFVTFPLLEMHGMSFQL